MHGTKESVGVSSSPTGAKVTIDNKDFGVTPIVADLRRKDHHFIKIELEGYQPYEITLTRKTSGWVWGNIIFGGVIGLVIDAISGALYKLQPNEVNAALQHLSLGKLEGKIIIVVVLEPDQKWEKIGNFKR